MNKLQTIFMNLFPRDWVVIDTPLKGYSYEDKNANNKNIFVKRA